MLKLLFSTLLNMRTVTEGLLVASRPRKRKLFFKDSLTTQEESTSGLGDEAIDEEPGEEGFDIIRSIRFEGY